MSSQLRGKKSKLAKSETHNYIYGSHKVQLAFCIYTICNVDMVTCIYKMLLRCKLR